MPTALSQNGEMLSMLSAMLKHSLPGDFNLFGVADVLAVMGEGGFDVKR